MNNNYLNPHTKIKYEGFMKKIFSLIIALMFMFVFVGCEEKSTQIELPQNISLTEKDNQPKLKFYDINTKKITELELEEYLEGVLAGEIFNSWPIEALKAQAILARTYTVYFLKNLKSKYEGADISNDISEAQAYDASKINDNIKIAVAETRGKVIVADNEPIQAWFHSNSGGKTTTANMGLNYKDEEKYTKIVNSPETNENSQNYTWTAKFDKSDILSALRKMGVSVSSITDFKIGKKDDSGRAVSFLMGGAEFSANTFRSKIGSTKMKSTLITDIVVSSSSVVIEGKGYGHGVGMSQWGAKIMADEGKYAEEIIDYYFGNVSIVQSEYIVK